MGKSPLEKQIEKQMKQAKQIADKQRRDEQKHLREEKRMAQKVALRERASSVVNGQPFVEGFRIMDTTAEEVLECLLNSERENENRVTFTDDIFPEYLQMSTDVELEKLVQYGMVGGLVSWDMGGILTLLPPAFTYFVEKEAAEERQRRRQEGAQMQSINNYGIYISGNVSGSTLTVDNSIHQIERAIEENGAEDKEELYEVLNEVKELIENMEMSRSIPKQKRLHQKLSEHMVKHGWFYGAVVQLLGTSALNMLGA